MSAESFGAWLSAALKRREMNQSDLARRIGSGSGAVNQWVRGARVPSVESCWRIADAFDLPVVMVLRRAGHPVEEGDGDDDEDRLLAMWRKLTPDGREDVMQFVEFRRARERKDA